MPSPLNPGTDIKSVTMPAAIVELSHKLQAKELAIPEDTRPDNITIAYDGDAETVTINGTFPIKYHLDEDGKPVATVTDYIV